MAIQPTHQSKKNFSETLFAGNTALPVDVNKKIRSIQNGHTRTKPITFGKNASRNCTTIGVPGVACIPIPMTAPHSPQNSNSRHHQWLSGGQILNQYWSEDFYFHSRHRQWSSKIIEKSKMCKEAKGELERLRTACKRKNEAHGQISVNVWTQKQSIIRWVSLRIPELKPSPTCIINQIKTQA